MSDGSVTSIGGVFDDNDTSVEAFAAELRVVANLVENKKLYAFHFVYEQRDEEGDGTIRDLRMGPSLIYVKGLVQDAQERIQRG